MGRAGGLGGRGGLVWALEEDMARPIKKMVVTNARRRRR